MKLHRNSQKRFYREGFTYFIVTKTHCNFPYFKERIFCDLFVEELRLCKSLKQFKLYGFSIIYDHLNLLIQPNNEYNISMVMKSLKENVSRDINRVIGCSGFEGDTSTCRLQIRKSIVHFRNKFIKKNKLNPLWLPQFKWQSSFHDHYIRDDWDFENHYYYTVYNHKKHGLPKSWPYTSLNYPDLIDETDLLQFFNY